MIRLAASGAPPRRLTQLLVLLLVIGTFAVQLIAAALPNGALLAAAVAVGMLLDLGIVSKKLDLKPALSKVRATLLVRQLLRDLILLLGLGRLGHLEAIREYLPVAFAVMGVYALHMATHGLALFVRRARQLPLVTRNIDARPLHPTTAPPQLLVRSSEWRLLMLGAPATLGLAVTALTETRSALYAVIGSGISALAMAAGLFALGTWLTARRRPVSRDQALDYLDTWLAEYQPSVALYFSGGKTSAYQANMWLSTLEQLGGRPLIVLRERFMVQEIGPTDIPILCLPRVSTLMRLENSALRVVLHPANSGKTSQILRIPTLKHTFINHGESDKLSSCNPYAKAYDEVWVAGPAARARYALADVGVEDKDVVEVGRPQLDGIERRTTAPAEDRPLTVLYAPTWEGWTDDPGNTSVILAGENIVRNLLALGPAVRLVYKPHPMTGNVDPRAKAANERMKAMIHEANTQILGEVPAGALAELTRCRTELDRLTATAFRRSADELERMTVQGVPEPGRTAERRAAMAAWERAWWAALPTLQHQVITEKLPEIYSFYNHADLLISDVSSVIPDYLASEKPYAVANTSGLSEDVFRETFPTVRAGTVLNLEADGLEKLLAAVRDPELDHYAAARRELKEQLLGPSEPTSLERFDGAVQVLAGKAEARARRMAGLVDGPGSHADGGGRMLGDGPEEPSVEALENGELPESRENAELLGGAEPGDFEDEEPPFPSQRRDDVVEAAALPQTT